MFKLELEYKNGILFARLKGILNRKNSYKINNYLNPVIKKQKGEQEVEEGCLSFPNQFAKIIRPAEVTIEALNEEGKKIKLKGTGLLAQAISHELDHLDGILFVDKIIPGTLEYVNSEEKEKK